MMAGPTICGTELYILKGDVPEIEIEVGRIPVNEPTPRALRAKTFTTRWIGSPSCERATNLGQLSESRDRVAEAIPNGAPTGEGFAAITDLRGARGLQELHPAEVPGSSA